MKIDIHTHILPENWPNLKKEFGLIESKRLSHIWHMTLDKDDKPSTGAPPGDETNTISKIRSGTYYYQEGRQ